MVTTDCRAIIRVTTDHNGTTSRIIDIYDESDYCQKFADDYNRTVGDPYSTFEVVRLGDFEITEDYLASVQENIDRCEEALSKAKGFLESLKFTKNGAELINK